MIEPYKIHIDAEKLYQFQHPKHVTEFDALCENRLPGTFWISKAWLKGTIPLITLEKKRTHYWLRLETTKTEDAPYRSGRSTA